MPKALTLPTARRIARSTRSYLTPEEMLAVLKIARARSLRDWCMILIAYRNGLRASEVCGLRLQHVSIKNQTIAVRRLKGSLETLQPLYPHRGRPLLDELAALRTYLRERESDGSDFLFLSQKGGKLHRTAFFRIFRSIAEAAHLPADKRHPHTLKHSLATHMIAENVNLALVKQMLGHSSIASTMRYIGTNDRQASEAAGVAMMSLY